MEICTNCNGEGLAGSGDKPWLRHGAVSTCTVCAGTGQLNRSVPESAAPELPPAAEPVDNPATEPATEPELSDN